MDRISQQLHAIEVKIHDEEIVSRLSPVETPEGQQSVARDARPVVEDVLGRLFGGLYRRVPHHPPYV